MACKACGQPSNGLRATCLRCAAPLPVAFSKPKMRDANSGSDIERDSESDGDECDESPKRQRARGKRIMPERNVSTEGARDFCQAAHRNVRKNDQFVAHRREHLRSQKQRRDMVRKYEREKKAGWAHNTRRTSFFWRRPVRDSLTLAGTQCGGCTRWKGPACALL